VSFRNPHVKKLNDITLPDEAVRYAVAQVDAGRFRSIDEAIAAGIAALRERDEDGQQWCAFARARFAEGRAAFERGEGVETTPDELMDGIGAELGIAPRP